MVTGREEGDIPLPADRKQNVPSFGFETHSKQKTV